MKSRALIQGFLYLAITIFFLQGCEKPEEPREQLTEDEEAIQRIETIFNNYYLWYDSLSYPAKDNYDDPYQYVADLKVKPIDRFSYLTTTEEFEQYYSAGAYYGHGFSWKYDLDTNLRIVFVYKDSPLFEEGVRRGWIVKKINGTNVGLDVDVNGLLGPPEEGVTNTLTFLTNEGETKTITSSKKQISVNTVLHSEIITIGARRVGYIVFESFIQKSTAELEEAFSEFNNEGIDDLVVDLRYNGGGMMDVALKFAGMIAYDQLGSKDFVNIVHNDKNASLDSTDQIKQSGFSLGLGRLFFITSGGTASASEVMINGFEPYMEVYVVGDKTFGKPVGMYPFEIRTTKYTLVPICFKLANSLGYGDYYFGIPVDAEAEDDLSREFGDPQEASLAEVLYFIENNHFSNQVKGRIPFFREKQPTARLRGLRFEIGAY